MQFNKPPNRMAFSKMVEKQNESETTGDLPVIQAFSVTVPIIIRSARESDLPKLEWGGTFRKYRQIFRQAYNDQLRNRRLMIVADINNYPVGQIFVQFSPGNLAYADGANRSYLYALRVMPHLRGHGLGTRLIEAAEQTAIERSYLYMTIAVAKENNGALKLYQRLGYEIFTEDPGKWQYTDPDGIVHYVEEPCWALEKKLG